MKVLDSLHKLLRCQKGAVAVLAAAALVGMASMAALAVDVGVLYLNRYSWLTQLKRRIGRGSGLPEAIRRFRPQ